MYYIRFIFGKMSKLYTFNYNPFHIYNMQHKHPFHPIKASLNFTSNSIIFIMLYVFGFNDKLSAYYDGNADASLLFRLPV